MVVFCTQCGKKNHGKAKFCTKCGAQLVIATPAARSAQSAFSGQPVQPVLPVPAQPAPAVAPAVPVQPPSKILPPAPKKPAQKPVNKNEETADDSSNFSIGLNYPGISVKYKINPKIALEARYQSYEGVALYGPRVYKISGNNTGKLVTFYGVELDMVSFQGVITRGSGLAVEPFFGGELAISRNLSAQLDFGPAFISLNDSNFSVSQSGLEFVVNFGLNIYFGSGSD